VEVWRTVIVEVHPDDDRDGGSAQG
jgi:hypothetical protein